MINKKIEDAINAQITFEFYSANIYLAMSAYLDSINLVGFANRMRVQYQEENFHALKMYDYLLERGGNAVIDAIPRPEANWNSILEVFEETLKHEQEVTRRIHEIYDLALAERDHATLSVMSWFIDEQVEEESSVGQILEELKMVADNKAALFMLDREFKSYVFTPPAQ